ncbi:hypothetical protein V6N13_105222 [Hibiscus sabdariffa]
MTKADFGGNNELSAVAVQSTGNARTTSSSTRRESTSVSISVTSLEELIAEDQFPEYPTVENHGAETNGYLGENAGVKKPSVPENHIDVSEEDGWITIPYKDLPDDWNRAPDIRSLHSLDRSFVSPGEQVHVLACLSACNQETEIITPFKVAAVMSKNGKRKGAQKQNGNTEGETNPVPEEGNVSLNGAVMDHNGDNLEKDKIDPAKDVSASESFLRMEDHRRQTETRLKRFKNSHFFVRIAESGEPLWSKKGASGTASELSEMVSQQSNANETKNTVKNISTRNAIIDRGNFDANVSGGVARDSIKCCSLSNGDIVVLLKVNVGVDFLRDPVIEILQFEKYQDRNAYSENLDNLVYPNQDPCRELLKCPIEESDSLVYTGGEDSGDIEGEANDEDSEATVDAGTVGVGEVDEHPETIGTGSASGIGSTSQRSSQLFSFAQSSKSSFDLNEVDYSSSQKNLKGKNTGTEELLSFMGVSLERERFSVHCGLEGIRIPGRRWRRKLQIIQPIKIHSYATECNTNDFLCVQIKNVSPENVADIVVDIVVYIDAISVVLEEASKGGSPASLPISCIEVGDDHSLPNLALRRGEEHSFIIKPVSSIWKDVKTYGDKSKSFGLQPPSRTSDRKGSVSVVNHYAVMPTSWRPRILRDLMISVASEMSGQYSGPKERATQLPVQVLTLQASNLSPEDLTMTVLAPTSFTCPPSVVSLNSPTIPMSPFVGFSEVAGKVGRERQATAVQGPSSMPTISNNQKENGDAGARFTSSNEQLTLIADFIPTCGLGCTHLWLQSRVPLGCVPAQSTATIKLELLPLTDGIITLDTLQIYVKEKGLAYIPEHSLMINATSECLHRDYLGRVAACISFFILLFIGANKDFEGSFQFCRIFGTQLCNFGVSEA